MRRIGWVVCLLTALPVVAAEPKRLSTDEALKLLATSPKDPYLQYVACVVASREGRFREAYDLVLRSRPGVPERERNVDLFSTFTGALAIQETLQLNTLRGDDGPHGFPGAKGPDRMLIAPPAPPGGLPPKATGPAPPPVKLDLPKAAPPKAQIDLPTKLFPINTVQGPRAPAHPWEKMLGDKKPEVGVMANLVPVDFWFAEFRSLAKINEVTQMADLWGGHLAAQVLGEGHSATTLNRIKTELGMGKIPPEMLDGIKVDGVAMCGSDLFMNEGSDITVLIKGDGVAGLLRLSAPILKLSGKSTGGEHNGVAYTHVISPSRSINVYTATPMPGLHVRSNSLAALKRVLDTIAGKSPSLGGSIEFQYVRSLMPYRAPEEDGFVYLSDPFIRSLLGPQIKLTERRRLLVYNHLRMIGHACLLYRTETGKAPKSLKDLKDAGCSPEIFGEGSLKHPDGGTYSLAADGMGGVCSKWGTIDHLRPCIDHPLTEVTGNELKEYGQFVAEYDQYWSTFFDPIILRLATNGKKQRLETLVLPLIDNSIYSALAGVVGGKVVPLDSLPKLDREMAGMWLHLEKKQLVEALGPETKTVPEKAITRNGVKPLRVATNDLKQLMLGLHNYHDTMNTFPASEMIIPPAQAGLSWRVHLLPYIEQDNLYRQFKLDEPWDSEHNKKLIPLMPKLFSGPNPKVNAEFKTCYLGVYGTGCVFDGKKGTRITDMLDGTSNTVAVVEVADEAAVVWTKPDDWKFDAKAPLRGLTRPEQKVFLAAMGDGSVRSISLQLSPDDLRRAFLRADGEPLNLEPVRPRPAQPTRPKVAIDFQNDLKQIALGVHNIEGAYGHLPGNAVRDQQGKALLSWRVHLLPYIEQDNLYRQFKLDEPWDSEHNKKLIEQMPRIYHGLDAKLNTAGRTTFVVPVGEATMFHPKGNRLTFVSVTDGLSNTILATRTTDDRAVIWTKPEDVEVDLTNPKKGLRVENNVILVAMADGSVRQFVGTIDDTKLVGLLTRAGGEVFAIDPTDEVSVANRRNAVMIPPIAFDERDFEQLASIGIDLNKLRRFIRDGVGDQIGLHLFDSEALIEPDLVMPGGGGGNEFGLSNQMSMGIGLLARFLIGPSAISIPVKDVKVVDEFLDNLDDAIAQQKADVQNIGRAQVDWHRLSHKSEGVIRCLTVRTFGVKARLYLARIGNGLYVANRLSVINSILKAANGPKRTDSVEGHALLRLRAENWVESLPGIKLSMAERHRDAALANLSAIESVARAYGATRVTDDLLDKVRRTYGFRPVCPDGGEYVLKDGQCSSSLHGNHANPRTLAEPSASSPSGRWIQSLGGIKATLTFEKDGLRAIVEIDRKD